MVKRKGLCFDDIHGFLEGLYQNDWYAKRLYSLANVTLGVLTSALHHWRIYTIGQLLA